MTIRKGKVYGTRKERLRISTVIVIIGVAFLIHLLAPLFKFPW